MQQFDSSDLLEITSNKITKKIELIAKLRKEIINYTNNFREYKILKSDIIERLIDNEEDFRQLNLIVKSITEHNSIQRETIETLEKRLEKTESQLGNSVTENKNLTNEKEEANKRIEFLEKANEEKELYVHELLSKIVFLEDVIKDYQKRIFISKYDRMFSYRSPFKSEERLKKFYEKFLQNEFKVHHNPYYWLYLKNPFNFSSKNHEDEQKPASLGKRNQESIADLVKNRPKSSTAVLNENNNNSKNKVNTTSNEVFEGLSNNLANKEKSQSQNDLNFILNNNNKKLNTREKEADAINIKNNTLNTNFQSQVDDVLLKRNISNSNGAYSNKNQSSNNAEYNKFNNNTNIETVKLNQNTISNSNQNKTSQEKERANRVSELLLKIFSSANISRSLKRKLGENFEIKLTDKQVDPNFIQLVENEVFDLIEKEKQRESVIKERFELNKMRKSLVGRGSNIRPISPTSDSEDMFSQKPNKAFNNYTKNTSGFFDPKLQYGGESCVPSTTRAKSNERINYGSINNKKRESKNRLSFDNDSNQYLFREQQGWNTLKDYFGNN